MNTSESTVNIFAALVAAQADIKGVEKSAQNPHFKSKYAPLDGIIDMVRPALAKHGLAVLQSAEQAGPDALDVETRIIHTSGEWIANAVYIPLAKKDPQGAGAAVTYGRRFGLSAMLSISTDVDDDGNNASAPAKAPQKRQERPAVSQSPTTPAVDAEALKSALERNTGAPEDRRFKGRRLGDLSKDELTKIRRWALNQGNPELADFTRDVVKVIAGLSLGMDEAARVERMKQEVEDETKPLDALFDTPKSPSPQSSGH